jgi:hypothetical protein
MAVANQVVGDVSTRAVPVPNCYLLVDRLFSVRPPYFDVLELSTLIPTSN